MSGFQIKGWKVYEEQQTPRGNKWVAISKLFTVKSAADQFAQLAGIDHKAIEVRTEHCMEKELRK